MFDRETELNIAILDLIEYLGICEFDTGQPNWCLKHQRFDCRMLLIFNNIRSLLKE